jgi:hypothetical protein
MQKKALTILSLCVLIILISLVAIFASQSINKNTPVNALPPLELDFKVWTIGDSEALTSFIDVANSHGAETAALDIKRFESNSNLKESVLNKQSLIVIDGNWLKQNDNQQLYDFLKTTTKNVGGIIVTGELPSNLDIILDKADIYLLPRDENGNLRISGAENSRFVGFALVQARDRDGTSHYVPSHFSTGDIDSYGAIRGIVGWLNHNYEMSLYNNDTSFGWF